jgi:hypothetical protein
MKQQTKKAITALLMLLDSEGFEAFAEIPYRELIKPLVRRDRLAGCSYAKISIRYGISVSKTRRILKSMSKADKEPLSKS